MSAGGVLCECEHDFQRYFTAHSTLGRVFYEACRCGAQRSWLPDYAEWERRHFPGAQKEGSA